MTKTIFHMANNGNEIEVVHFPSGAIDIEMRAPGGLIRMAFSPDDATALGVALNTASFPHIGGSRTRGKLPAF